METLYQYYLNASEVSTDTRTLQSGAIFFALSGDNHDGNKYVQLALDKGASHIVCSDKSYEDNPQFIVVDDVLKTLQDLATYHRKKLPYPVLAITGSNGKTTTKELVKSVLSIQLKTEATAGNFNNHIGVPLTLLSFSTTSDFGIVEMGANHQGEIAMLCDIALPDYGVITNYGKAHLEGFGGVDGVIAGKSELFTHLKKHNKTAFVAQWDELQIEKTVGMKTIPTVNYTTSSSSDSNNYVSISWRDQLIHSQLTGKYNAQNIAIAITIGEHFNITNSNIKKGIEQYVSSNNRSQLIAIKGLKIILDAYNANPSSMKHALHNLSTIKSSSRIAILGDMFELGEYAVEEHNEIAQLASTLNLDKTFLIGKHFKETAFMDAINYESVEEFMDKEQLLSLAPAAVLIKGSRGMQLEKIVENLKQLKKSD